MAQVIEPVTPSTSANSMSPPPPPRPPPPLQDSPRPPIILNCPKFAPQLAIPCNRQLCVSLDAPAPPCTIVSSGRSSAPVDKSSVDDHLGGITVEVAASLHIHSTALRVQDASASVAKVKVESARGSSVAGSSTGAPVQKATGAHSHPPKLPSQVLAVNSMPESLAGRGVSDNPEWHASQLPRPPLLPASPPPLDAAAIHHTSSHASKLMGLARSAAADEGNAEFAGWAMAANLTVAELQQTIDEGRAAEDHIVRHNIGLVGKAINQMKRASGGRIDRGTSEQDLMQEGCIALIKAAEKFDVSLGCRFSTYATFWVRNALTKTLHDQSRVVRLPGRVHNTYSRIKRATSELIAEDRLGDARPTDEQIAQRTELGISGEKARQVINHMRQKPSSLDASVGGRSHKWSGDEKTLADFITDEGQEAQVILVNTMLKGDISRLMKKHLDPHEIKVISLRFGLRDGQYRTVRAVGEELSITQTQARQLLFSALTKLRRPHIAHALRDYVTEDSIGT